MKGIMIAIRNARRRGEGQGELRIFLCCCDAAVMLLRPLNGSIHNIQSVIWEMLARQCQSDFYWTHRRLLAIVQQSWDCSPLVANIVLLLLLLLIFMMMIWWDSDSVWFMASHRRRRVRLEWDLERNFVSETDYVCIIYYIEPWPGS